MKPLLKPFGLVLLYKNFGPISNLPYICKRSASEMALVRVKNNNVMNMNKGQVTPLVLLDLSLAFDIVDHGSLLKSLQSRFRVSGKVLEWVASYLYNRIQPVTINGNQSDSFPLQYGVPQGSCLGPILFVIYATKLFEIISCHLPDVHSYADDAQLYLSFKPDSHTSHVKAVTAMKRCIEDLRQWMLLDRLKLNDDKTEYLLIGTRRQLDKLCDVIPCCG